MSTLRVTCPACKKAFDVPARKAGEKVECPECFEQFTAKEPKGPQIQIVITHGAPAGKAKGRRRNDEDDDEYDHDRREADDDEDYAPPRGGYRGGPSPTLPVI